MFLELHWFHVEWTAYFALKYALLKLKCTSNGPNFISTYPRLSRVREKKIELLLWN
jgi:hypothetical protein